MPGGAKKIRIVLAEDHEIVYKGLRDLLMPSVGGEIVAWCESAEAALAAIVELDPEVLILDLKLPGKGGLWLLEEIGRRHIECRVIVFTGSDDRMEAERARVRGAFAVVRKADPVPDLIDAIHAAAGRHSSTVKREERAGSLDLSILSPRQAEIIRLVSKGFTSAQVASKLGLAVKSVETHRERAIHRLGLESWRELIRMIPEEPTRFSR